MLQGLCKELISSFKITALVLDLSEGHESLTLRLCIFTGARKLKCLLGLAAGLLYAATLEQEFCQAGQTDRNRDFVIKFPLNGYGTFVLSLRTIEVILPLRALPRRWCVRPTMRCSSRIS